MTVVWIPALLRPLAGGAETVRVSGATLREVIEDLDRQHPGLRDRLLENGLIRPEIALAVGSDAVSDLNASVADESEVHILPAISGGSGTIHRRAGLPSAGVPYHHSGCTLVSTSAR
ncbi:MAG: MoaD/ThiS family protein [Dehalococcoidia bacterium]